MFLGILVLITALTISGVAIYYSIAGLVAIFAAAAIPIMVMGGALEIGKLVTAVWLHRYWKRTVWWLRTYLAVAVVVLMFITSMGIFGFLSKAHIEQTSASKESIEQVERIKTELARLDSIIVRAEEKINKAENSTSTRNDDINAQIEKEQKRIDNAYTRIQPAIDEQQRIIADARESDAGRTKPYEDQLTNIKDEIIRLETSAKEYEETIANLDVDTSAIVPIQEQIATINNTISKVEGQIASGESEQIKQAQLTIGSNADGQAGPNTRRSANTWIGLQKERISELQEQISQLRIEAKTTVDDERNRLSAIVNDIRNVQIPTLKDREVQMLAKIDEVRATESPIVSCACLICSLSPLAICPSTFAIVFLIVAICACIGSIALVSTSSPAIVVSYSFALFSNLTNSSVILVNWSSYGLVLSASLDLASAMIFCCSSIAGLIRSYALSIRCCSFSICAFISSLRLPVLFSASFIFISARSIIACCLASSVSIRATCSTLSILAEVCSMCALDKKPNIPMLVINISTTTARAK